ncbi:MAG: type IV secretion system DNA-binding domain-containing protein [Planctomycetota bacterium]
MLFQFSTNGQTDREEVCESFDQLLQTFHQTLLLQQSSLSLELGVIDGEVVQAFRTQNEHARRTIKNALRNVFPSCRVSNLPDGAFTPKNECSRYFADVSLTNDLFAIRRWRELLTQSDPFTNLLAALGVNHHAKFTGHISIAVTPLPQRLLRIHQKAFETLQGETLLRHQTLAKLYERLARSSYLLLRIPTSIVNRFIDRDRDEPSMTVGSSRHHERETDVQSASNKLNSACFATRIRISVYGPSDQPDLATSLIQQVYSPLAQFNAPRLGQFTIGPTLTAPKKRRSRFFILSCQELSSIWHPPVTQTQRLSTTRFVQLEAPKALPIGKQTNTTAKLGRTCFHDHQELFGLHDRDFSLHGFVVGSSGSGKTTLLTSTIKSLIDRGQGVTLVDFHGDFANSITKQVPKRCRERLVEFSPLHSHPITFNPLSCPNRDYWPIVADSVLSGMKNLFGSSWGPRLEQILSMALSAAVAAGDTTFADVRKMLSHEPTRVGILSRVDDKIVREFWFETFESWGKRLQVEATQSVVNKLDALLTPKLRAMLCQRGQSFDFRRAFDEGKIVIVNLARGQMGQTAASTLGSLILSSIQNAALSRAEIPESERVPHSVFLDELQLYSNPQALTSLLSEARKYRVAVWSATQSLASLSSDEVLPIVLANAANFVSFRVSQKDAVEISPMLDDKVRPQDLVSLPRFHGYARVMVGGEVQMPFSFTTIK